MLFVFSACCLMANYSNLLIVATFSNSPFSNKTYSPVKDIYIYMLTFSDDKSRILAACLSKSY